MVEFSLWDIFRNRALAARWIVARSLVAGYVQVFQGVPLLIQLFLIFFGISLFAISVLPWLAASVCLTLDASAYLTEIWRGCVDAAPKGQWEAAKSLVLTFAQQLRFSSR